MFDKIKKHPLWKAYMKLPLWGQIAVPAAIIILVRALLSTLGFAIKIGIVAAIVLGVITLFNSYKKKDGGMRS